MPCKIDRATRCAARTMTATVSRRALTAAASRGRRTRPMASITWLGRWCGRCLIVRAPTSFQLLVLVAALLTSLNPSPRTRTPMLACNGLTILTAGTPLLSDASYARMAERGGALWESMLCATRARAWSEAWRWKRLTSASAPRFQLCAVP